MVILLLCTTGVALECCPSCLAQTGYLPPRIPRMHQNDSPSALVLLKEAVQLSHLFNVDERADVLIDAGEVAAQIDTQSANTWSKGAFALSMDMPSGQDRAATQKNALRTLALNAPAEALRFYRKQDLPSNWGKPSEMSEDPRALSDPAC